MTTKAPMKAMPQVVTMMFQMVTMLETTIKKLWCCQCASEGVINQVFPLL